MNPETPINPGELSQAARIASNKFLERMRPIADIPELAFHPQASVFVCIPIYNESENIERLFDAWQQQQVNAGTQVEVIFLVNNRASSPDNVKMDNQRTFDRLQERIAQSKGQQVNFHVVDAFSQDHALPDSVELGTIRNLALVPVVRHALATNHNAIMHTTDADAFPEPTLAQTLYDTYSHHPRAYGSIERNLEFDAIFTEAERRDINKLLLVSQAADIMLEYLSDGRWEIQDTMGGPNTFFTLDAFVGVGGYSGEKNVPEDIQMSLALHNQFPHDFHPMTTVATTTMVRLSDRVKGDGAFLSEIRAQNYHTYLHSSTTLAMVGLREWLNQAALAGDTIQGAAKIQSLVSFLNEQDIECHIEDFQIDSQLDQQEQATNLYRQALNLLGKRQFSLDDAIESYNDLIEELLQDDPEFIDLVTDALSTSTTMDYPVLYALQAYVARKVRQQS